MCGRTDRKVLLDRIACEPKAILLGELVKKVQSASDEIAAGELQQKFGIGGRLPLLFLIGIHRPTTGPADRARWLVEYSFSFETVNGQRIKAKLILVKYELPRGHYD